MKENRRVQMTKRLLKDSVFELLELKPLNKITIKEICDNANINRTTFYKYYGDQYSLVKEAEDELLNKTSEFILNINKKNEKVIILSEFLDYIKKNADIFRILLNPNSNTDFRYKLLNVVVIIVTSENYNLNLNDEDKKYLYEMIIMGSIGTVELWLNSSCKKPVDNLAELILNFVSYGINGVTTIKTLE